MSNGLVSVSLRQTTVLQHSNMLCFHQISPVTERNLLYFSVAKYSKCRWMGDYDDRFSCAYAAEKEIV